MLQKPKLSAGLISPPGSYADVTLLNLAVIHCIIDIDECEGGLHGCHGNAVCNNLKGSYNCSCKPGFSGDGKKSCEGESRVSVT